MTQKSQSMVWLGVAAVVTLSVAPAPASAQTIRACKNPAGQVRLIGETESCKSQETLVTWNDDSGAAGVTGGSDKGPGPDGQPFTPLFSDFVDLTTENIGTGFPGYMVWATVAVELYGPTPTAPPSPNNPGCLLVYTVNGQGHESGQPWLADGRGVAFPTVTLPPNAPARFVRLNITMNGLITMNASTPIKPEDVVDVTLRCNTPGASPTTPNPVMVRNWSLTGIGVNRGFQQP